MSGNRRNRLSAGWGNAPDNRRTCMLLITHACNLNCSYCYEPFKSDRKMSFADAAAFVLKEAAKVRRSTKYEELEIDLMGGEPMTHFPLIRRLVEWAEDGNIPVPWIFSMTTNGTLFTPEIRQWFRKHRQSLSVCLSHDGTEAMQHRNRGTAGEAVDLDFFLDCWPDQGPHLTISRAGLPHLAEGVLHFQRRGVPVEAALAEGLDWTPEDARVYREQLETIAEACLRDEALPALNLLCRPLDIVHPKKDRRKIRRFCGAGTGMIAYDVNGRTYPCHMFSPLVLGEDAVEPGDALLKRADAREDPECRACALKHFCPTCAGFNLKYRGDIRHRDKRKCGMHLVEAHVAAKFQIKLLAGQKAPLSGDEAEYADRAMAALAILDHLANTVERPYC